MTLPKVLLASASDMLKVRSMNSRVVVISSRAGRQLGARVVSKSIVRGIAGSQQRSSNSRSGEQLELAAEQGSMEHI